MKKSDFSLLCEFSVVLVSRSDTFASDDIHSFFAAFRSSQSVMIEDLLLRFSRENFDDANYVPLLHGHSETAKPLSLIIKQKRSIWKRPFAKNEIIILDGLENFVSSDCEKEYLEAVKLNVIEQVLEKGKNAPVKRYKRMNEILP